MTVRRIITLFHPTPFHKILCPLGGLKVIGGSCSRDRICPSFIISIPSHYCSFWGLCLYTSSHSFFAVDKLGLRGWFPNLPNSVTHLLSLSHRENVGICLTTLIATIYHVKVRGGGKKEPYFGCKAAWRSLTLIAQWAQAMLWSHLLAFFTIDGRWCETVTYPQLLMDFSEAILCNTQLKR